MTRALFVFALLLAPSFAVASANSSQTPSDVFVYDFPGCNGGGGVWSPAIVEIPQSFCAADAGQPVPVVDFGGHCNGRLTIGAVCSEGAVVDGEILECFCD